MIRLNDAQHRRVKKLTRCHCANNVRGCCLAATADTRKKCELCGKPFPARSNRAKYCDRCAPYAARRNAAERKRRQRAKARCVTV